MAKKVTNLLAGLPPEVSIRSTETHPDCISLTLDIPEPDRICPKCGAGGCTSKGTAAPLRVRHLPSANMGLKLTIPRRRYSCHSCGSTYYCRPDWVHESIHVTKSLYIQICLSLTDLVSIREAAKRSKVQEDVVRGVLDDLTFGRPAKLPVTLSVDEFKGDAGTWNPAARCWDTSRFLCSVVDGDSGVVLDVLPYITAKELTAYFRQYPLYERKQVKYFSCDMHNGFISVAKSCFPDSKICIDLFHVVNKLNDALDAVRRRLQNAFLEQEDRASYDTLKHCAYLLKTNTAVPAASWTEKKQQRLENALSLSKDLSSVYDAVQNFHAINAQKEYALKRADLTEWVNSGIHSEIPELRAAANTVKHWRSYIQNSWKYGRSNGPCEGLNNRIKVLKRISFGVHDFEMFRKRILLTCGSLRQDSSSYALFERQAGRHKAKCADTPTEGDMPL